MKIWDVLFYDDESGDAYTLGVFSDREKAIQAVCLFLNCEVYELEDMDVDSKGGEMHYYEDKTDHCSYRIAITPLILNILTD